MPSTEPSCHDRGMIATKRRRAGTTGTAGPVARSEVPTVSLPAQGARSRAAVRRSAWTRQVVLLCLLATAAGGCGLSAEIDRERDPGRTAVPAPSETSDDGSLVIEVPVPSMTAPKTQDGHCPASGLRLDTGPVDAAMGLRGMTLTLTDCGERPYRVNGYPAVLDVLDDGGAPITGVRGVTGTDKVPMAPADPGPKPFTLHPGQSARAALYWRMAAQDGVYLRLAPQKGQRAVTLKLTDPLDIGPENILGTTAWEPAP